MRKKNEKVWEENGKWMAEWEDGSVFDFDTKEEAEESLDRTGSFVLFDDCDDEEGVPAPEDFDPEEYERLENEDAE